MRLLLPALLLCFCLSLPAPAHAERIMEVQGVHVEQQGAGGRDAAVTEATKQAAAQVWSKLGHDTPLPDLSPEQLQTLSSYVDVANESAQPNYYAANFNIGIRVNALLRLTGASAAASEESSDSAAATAPAPASDYSVTDNAPRWILVVPAHETPAGLTLWNGADSWISAWTRASRGAGITTAAAGGDARDQELLTAEQLRDPSVPLDDRLAKLGQKYGAPAVALVVLRTSNDPIKLDDEMQLDVTYLENGQASALSAQGNVFVNSQIAANPLPAAITEAQRLIARLATGQPTEAQPQQAASYGPVSSGPAMSGAPGLTRNAATVYSGMASPVPEGESHLWVRIPLAKPSDLSSYRGKIDSIPGARFEITALNRMYVEGNIYYTGDQTALMQQLAAKGLSQQ